MEPIASDPAPPTGHAVDDRLDSWKEIATYLKRDVTTARRWERREAMPVHRHVHGKLGSVYAFRSELDAWVHSRKVTSPPDNTGTPAPELLPATEPPVTTGRRPVFARPFVFGSLAVAVIVAMAATWALARTDYFWRTPLARAQFHDITDFGNRNQSAVVSRDGRFVAFLSDNDGQLDVCVTQLGAGVTYNLTRGRFRDLSNPSVRMLNFSPDGATVTFWTRGAGASGSATDIAIWAVPTMGGQARPYLEGAAEVDWSPDGARVVYHTPGPGDPTFVKEAGTQDAGRQIFVAAAGQHAHFQRWSPDGQFIYFVQGQLPDGMDIWRIRPTGGPAERITSHQSRVSHPVFLDDRTLVYLATEPDGSGPWLMTIDVERRVARRASLGPDRYTSLAAAADGRQLVATAENTRRSLWRVAIDGATGSQASRSRSP